MTIEMWNNKFAEEEYDEEVEQTLTEPQEDEINQREIIKEKRKKFENSITEKVQKMKGMTDIPVDVPVVFVDSFVNNPKWKKYTDEFEKTIFNQELTKLTQFLDEKDEMMPFASSLISQIRCYFHQHCAIKLDNVPDIIEARNDTENDENSLYKDYPCPVDECLSLEYDIKECLR